MTGANSGIGKATAIGLGRMGADVVVNYVAGRDAAQDVVREIEAFGVRAYAHEADVSQEDPVVDMVSRMVEEFGTIDVMVPNAGLQRDAAPTDMTVAEWHKVLDVNLTGQFLCAREAAKEFVRRGVVPEASRSAGKIICMRPARPSSGRTATNSVRPQAAGSGACTSPWTGTPHGTVSPGAPATSCPPGSSTRSSRRWSHRDRTSRA